jgi:hypothetical protein
LHIIVLPISIGVDHDLPSYVDEQGKFPEDVRTVARWAMLRPCVELTLDETNLAPSIVFSVSLAGRELWRESQENDWANRIRR